MKLLITGATGQLGRAIRNTGEKPGRHIISLTRSDLDLTDPDSIKNALTNHPDADIVVNTAAYTAVDNAESEPEPAYAVNRDGAKHLAEACRGLNIPLIHISTDYVFDGTHSSPYVETDPVSPIGVYGRSKAAGEEEIRKVLPSHMIIRTSWLYGIHGNNFVRTMIRLGREREEIKVVDDQVGCPTSAADLANAVLKISERVTASRHEVAWGTYHYSNAGQTTWYGFAEKIFQLCRNRPGCGLKLKKLTPIPTTEYPTPAKRPPYSVLDCRKIMETFDITIPPWDESLARMLNRLFNTP